MSELRAVPTEPEIVGRSTLYVKQIIPGEGNTDSAFRAIDWRACASFDLESFPGPLQQKIGAALQQVIPDLQKVVEGDYAEELPPEGINYAVRIQEGLSCADFIMKARLVWALGPMTPRNGGN